MQSDRLSSSDSASATVIRGAGHREDVLVHGHYDVVCMAPVEERRAEYIALRDRIAAEELVGTDPALLEQLRAELAAIPQYERWRDSFDNLVTTVGKNDLLDKYLKGSAYTQTFVMGLKGAGSAAAGDTQASHAGWTERGGTNAPAYTGNRPAITFNSASSGSSSSPTTAFAITSAGNVDGCFMNNGGSATKDNTTGVLFSAGDFTGGAKTVGNGDTLNVTYTLSV
jgi:hypothetical protein